MGSRNFIMINYHLPQEHQMATVLVQHSTKISLLMINLMTNSHIIDKLIQKGESNFPIEKINFLN